MEGTRRGRESARKVSERVLVKEECKRNRLIE
jgi:hypothetical protein